MNRIIWQSAGADEYVTATVRDTTGNDLSSSTFTLGFGVGDDPPDDWSTPDDSTIVGADATVSLMTGTTDAGTYYLWVKVVDGPETIVLKGAEPITIA